MYVVRSVGVGLGSMVARPSADIDNLSLNAVTEILRAQYESDFKVQYVLLYLQLHCLLVSIVCSIVKISMFLSLYLLVRTCIMQ